MAFTKLLPVFSLLSIVTYIASVYCCIVIPWYTYNSRVAVVSMYSVILGLTCIALVQVTFGDPGSLKNDPRFQDSNLATRTDIPELHEKKLTPHKGIYEQVNDNIRLCYRCRIIKPDRTHHCSRCDKCFTGFDHHCPWLNTCIGHNNIKQFWLTLVYGTLLSIFVEGTTLPYLLSYDSSRDTSGGLIISVSMFTLNTVFSLVLIFYTSFMCINMCRNQTTKEFCENSKPSKAFKRRVNWDKGAIENLKEILGKDWYTWWIPYNIGRTDGTSFKPANTTESDERFLGSDKLYQEQSSI